MNFKKHLEIAWQTTLQHIVVLTLMALVMLMATILSLGILTPVLVAGFTQAIIRLMRTGRKPRIEDLFSHFGLFLPIVGFYIVVVIATLTGLLLLVLPGLAVVLAVAFGCIYMIPLMTDQKLELIEAVKTSWKMALDESVSDHIVVVVLYISLIAIGSSIWLGFLLTQPFATVFLISVYLEKINSSGTDAPQTSAPGT